MYIVVPAIRKGIEYNIHFKMFMSFRTPRICKMHTVISADNVPIAAPKPPSFGINSALTIKLIIAPATIDPISRWSLCFGIIYCVRRTFAKHIKRQLHIKIFTSGMHRSNPSPKNKGTKTSEILIIPKQVEDAKAMAKMILTTITLFVLN